MKVISQFKSKDVLGNNTTVVIIKDSLKKMDLYNLLENQFPNKDFCLDEVNQYGDGDKMYHVVFVGNVKF
tara:strand:- start:271 stop:480 length:210 start_codon:yes stop_codon:yes gene_type:complete